ncbi:hypothetical protein [Pseudonocardia dioxanivorans]|nr:hypothetical protein [Pseudonocardia dioxanivorans]
MTVLQQRMREMFVRMVEAKDASLVDIYSSRSSSSVSTATAGSCGCTS